MGSSLAGYTVEVSREYLPGALVLLQSSGYNQLVVELGSQWVASNPHDALIKDVAAAMALAHHDLALYVLEHDSSHVSEACRHLEAALVLLLRRSRRTREAGVAAQQLQQEVMQILEVGGAGGRQVAFHVHARD